MKTQVARALHSSLHRTAWSSAGLLAAWLMTFAAPALARDGNTAPAVVKASRESCALLDDAKTKGKMDGRLRALLIACGREHELGEVRQDVARPGVPGAGPGTPDVQVNTSSGDSGSSHTQSETSVAVNPTTGTLCSGFNDSYHALALGQGFTGFSRSTNGGASWSDRGPLGANSFGDPSVVWRAADGHFYFAALESNGLGIWRSTDDCLSFSFLGNTHLSFGDDKELMAVDNNPASPFYGRLYVAWTDFGAGGGIFANHSDDGSTWSTPVALSSPGADVQGAWPTIAPSGDVYVGWLRWNPFPDGPIDVEIARSTNGGGSFAAVASPMSGEINPRDPAATNNCFRPALNGNIRYLPSPQLAVGPDGVLHVVYSYDPDGFGTGDAVDVFYRRSLDNGTSWQTQVRLNDDATTRDQFFPSLSVGETNVVSAAWYDRRLDASNLLIDYYQSFSFDGGVTWGASTRVSDVSTPVYLDPELATCYHGDYDQQVQTAGLAHLVWADDRNLQGGHNDPDVWSESVPVGTDFLVLADPARLEVCKPADAVFTISLPQFNGFAEPVTLTTSGEPAGTTVGFSPNPVTPPGSSTLTLSSTGAAAAGTSAIDVVGTSSPGAIVHQATVTLTLFDGVPASVTLGSPADDAVDQALLPTLGWVALATATSYDVDVATDAGFSNVVATATVAGNSHTLTSPLAPLTEYFWRVRAGNVCGNGGFSAAFSFTTRAIPPVLLVDDDDAVFDARPLYETALGVLGRDFDVWNTANSDNEPTVSNLAPYRTVIWFTAHEFGGSAGPGGTGEAALASWLGSGGKCLFLSSQDYHFDRGLTAFMQTHLGVASITDDTGQTTVSGTGFLGGLGPYSLGFPFTDFSDVVTPGAGAQVSVIGNQGDTALRKDGGVYRTHFLVFPWETITTAAGREAVLERFFFDCAVFGPAIFADGFESGNTSAWSSTVP